MHWLTLTPADLSSVFNAQELAACTKGEYIPFVQDTLADITAMVREAVAANRANRLAPGDSIPRSLRPAALDLAALRLLKRFALAVTEERKHAAELAEERLDKVRKAEIPVLDENGNLPPQPALRPGIIAPHPAYGNNGTGWYPVPATTRRR